jgi:hypothetical protein
MNSLQVNQIIDTLDNKFLFNIDFPIDLNIISFDEYPLLHKLDEENVHLQANIFNDSNQGSLLKKKRNFEEIQSISDFGEIHYDHLRKSNELNYSRVSSKATSAISSLSFPFIDKEENIFNYENKENFHLSSTNNFDAINIFESKANQMNKENREFHISNMNSFGNFIKPSSDLNEIFKYIDENEKSPSKSKLSYSERENKSKSQKVKKLNSSGNPINKVIEFISKENIIIDKADSNTIFIQGYDLKRDISEDSPCLSHKKRILFASKRFSLSDSNPNSNSNSNPLHKKICCSCKKSHCLKLYCECFKNGRYCEFCSCPNCLNKEKFESLRTQSINFLKAKSKHAFKSVKIETDDKHHQHIKGCKCKNSNCKKNYCECYQNNMKCGDHCKCSGCMNDE